LLRYENIPAALACEFAGTFSLVTLGASQIIYFHTLSWPNVFETHLVNAMVVTAVVSGSILLFGNVSGAQLNPTVVISQAITGLMPRKLLIPFLFAQLLAAVASGFFLRAIFGPLLGAPTDFGEPRLEEGATIALGLTLEAIGGFGRAAASLYSSTNFKENARDQAVFTGIILFVLTASIGPFTGACFNAAVYLGPAVASMSFENQFVYWIAPIIGSIASVFWFFTRHGILPWLPRERLLQKKKEGSPVTRRDTLWIIREGEREKKMMGYFGRLGFLSSSAKPQPFGDDQK
jgi:glycerol uptake facilitator-like aquaporin